MSLAERKIRPRSPSLKVSSVIGMKLEEVGSLGVKVCILFRLGRKIPCVFITF